MTVVANPAAKEFYERCGFTVEGSAETRFGPALRMSR
jgi:ribosomal protein S18 acetylase RimI-like enzyme